MKRWLIFLAIVLLISMTLTLGLPAIASSVPVQPALSLYGHDNGDSSIWEINIDTGDRTYVGHTGFPGTMSGMATCRGIVEGPGDVLYKPGTMFALLTDEEDVDWVVVVDPTTGDTTKVVEITRPGPIGGRGIAFGPDGATLYLIESNGDLSTIDTKNGNVNLLAHTPWKAASLEYDPISDAFYTITTTTDPPDPPRHWLWKIINGSGGWGGIRLGETVPTCTLVMSPPKMGGNWYTVSGGVLHSINITNGDATPIGPGGLGPICGTAFAPERPRNIAPEQCKVTGGAEGEFEYRYLDDPITDHRISFGFTATSIGSPCVKERKYGYVVLWPAKGQFHMVNHTTGEKIRGTFEHIISEPPGFGNAVGYRPGWRLAQGKCTLDGEKYQLVVEARDNGEPGVEDFVSIELLDDGALVQWWHGLLDGGNLQVKCKGPEVELVKCPKPEPPE